MSKVKRNSGATTENPQASSGWRLVLSLGPDEVKQMDVVGILLAWLSLMNISESDRRRLFTIISELYTNAVDYGLLKVEPQSKQSADDVDAYFINRKRKLDLLKEGRIEVEVEKTVSFDKEGLKIRIKDSGQGFDHSQYLLVARSGEPKPFHCGILLVLSLCDSLRYIGEGNEVVAEYTFT